MNVLDHYNFESEYYDKLYGDFKDDVYTIKSISPRGKILEIFCGTGRIISSFSRGIGVDNNINMLLNGKNNYIKVLGDVFHLPFKPIFNFLIIGLNSLLLFKNEEKRAIISEVNKVTASKARIFIDILNGFSLEEREYTISAYREKEQSLRLTVFPERLKDSYILHYKYIIEDPITNVQRRDLIIYPLNLKEITEILDENGFEIKAKWGDYDLSPYNEKSDKIIIEAIKKD